MRSSETRKYDDVKALLTTGFGHRTPRCRVIHFVLSGAAGEILRCADCGSRGDIVVGEDAVAYASWKGRVFSVRI